MTSSGTASGIPEATVARLPEYLRALGSLLDRGVALCSSEQLAVATGVTSSKLRKDLSYLGSYGVRGVGYDVAHLREQISRHIGVAEERAVVIVGIGNLGHALSNYSGFTSRGFRIAALLDADPAKAGEIVGGLTVRSIEDLAAVVLEHAVSIGIIATPAAAAQEVCDRMVAAGVGSILNFAPVVPQAPSAVDVRTVDLACELQILAFHDQRKVSLGVTA